MLEATNKVMNLNLFWQKIVGRDNVNKGDKLYKDKEFRQ